MALNRFGAVYTSVASLYPQTAVADYGGQTPIEEALDRSSDQIANALTPLMYQQITEPDLEMIVRRAAAGQTSATLSIKPIISGSLHVWTGQPALFQERPLQSTEFYEVGGQPTGSLAGGQFELPSTSYSVNVTTGVVTLASPLAANDVVYATYQVDTSTLSLASLARIAVRGAAAELGARLYTQSTQEWALVSAYRDAFASDLAALKDGTMVPEELRNLRWWAEVERTSNRVGSIRLYRGG